MFVNKTTIVPEVLDPESMVALAPKTLPTKLHSILTGPDVVAGVGIE